MLTCIFKMYLIYWLYYTHILYRSLLNVLNNSINSVFCERFNSVTGIFPGFQLRITKGFLITTIVQINNPPGATQWIQWSAKHSVSLFFST